MTSPFLPRIIFPQKFALAKSPQQKLKILKSSYVRLWISNWVCIAFAAVLLAWLAFTLFPLSFKSYELTFDGLNATEQSHVQDVLSQLEPEYEALLRHVTVTHNLTPYLQSHLLSDPDEDEITDGFNPALSQGRIFVRYTDSDAYLKEIICHEILHSTISSGSHEIVYDLGRKHVCFKKPQKRLTFELTPPGGAR